MYYLLPIVILVFAALVESGPNQCQNNPRTATTCELGLFSPQIDIVDCTGCGANYHCPQQAFQDYNDCLPYPHMHLDTTTCQGVFVDTWSCPPPPTGVRPCAPQLAPSEYPCNQQGLCITSVVNMTEFPSVYNFKCDCYDGFCGDMCNVRWNDFPQINFFENSQCDCQSRWGGKMCDIPCSTRGTHSGVNGTCVCSSIQYQGADCQIDLMLTGSCMITQNDASLCNNHGTCSADFHSCACDFGWSGTSCATQCSGYGDVSNGTCQCDFGFTGDVCQNDLVAIGVCLSATSRTQLCSGNGVCSNSVNVCTCSPGWSGTSCDIPVCHDTSIAFNGTLCSGNGGCSLLNYIGSYCTCDPKWTGAYCSQPAHVCDCGVEWKSPSSYSMITSHVSMIIAGSVVPTDTRLLITNINMEQIVGTVEQAKYICYTTAACDGFLLHTDNSLQLTAAFFSNDTTTSITRKWQHYVDPPPTVYFIDRYMNNRCNNPSIDLTYYTRTYFQEILNDCVTFAINSSNALMSDGTIKQAADCRRESILTRWSNLHWQQRGYVKRYNPNSHCALLPTLYDPLTSCATSRVGCFGFPHPTDKPCSGQGFCDAVSGSTTAFQCNCDLFAGQYNAGVTLAGTPMYAGRACQYNMISSCSGEDDGVESVLCSSYIDACTPDKVWDGVSVFNTSYSFDYRPRCHCEDTLANRFPALGPNCQYSRCGDNALRCNTASDNSNVCSMLSATAADSTWGCTCGSRWIGPQCQYDATVCLKDGLKCSGHGTCMMADPSRNHTDPYCVCHTSTYSGIWCERQACPATVMALGHGECFDNVLDHCYPVYKGAICQVDICAKYNATIVPWSSVDGFPSQCACPAGWSAWVPNDVSCWPLCASNNGVTCGGLANTCDLFEGNNVRTARCLCAPGFIEKVNADGHTVCESYCIHGSYDSTMSWDARNPPPCLCHGTGFDTAGGHPRCDNIVCKNNGVYVQSSNSCTCPPPFTPHDNCVSNTCNNQPKLDQLVRGHIDESGSACACNRPFMPMLASSPFDCDGHYCGVHGNALMTWTHFMPATHMCNCVGKYQSVCQSTFDTTSCQFCSTATCLNGGLQLNVNPNICSCVFPFINGAKGICEINTCSTHSASYNATSCICSTGYTGDKCDARVYVPPPIIVRPTPLPPPPPAIVNVPVVVVTPIQANISAPTPDDNNPSLTNPSTPFTTSSSSYRMTYSFCVIVATLIAQFMLYKNPLV